MSAPDFTYNPPPWEVRSCKDQRGNVNSFDVCLQSEPDAVGVGVVASVYAGEGLARLIAAAPELYEALTKARNTLAGCGMEKIAADICDAALAKARGDQS